MGSPGPRVRPHPLVVMPPEPTDRQPTPSPEGLAKLLPTPLAGLYLALAAAGAVLPWMANLAFMRQYGSSFDLGQFVALANANPAAQSLSRDLAIGATAVTIWIVSEGRRLRMRGVIWVLLSCVTVAFAFGAPLFLYLRERRLQEMGS
jgi:hypothetical protein